MKFGKLLELLKKSPLFNNYLPNANFLPYKELNNLVKLISKCQDENEKKELIKDFNEKLLRYLQQWQDLADSFLKDKQLKDHIDFIKQYKALKEFRRINREGTRKIAKKFDRFVQPENPSLQTEILQIISKQDNKFVEEKFTNEEFAVIDQIESIFKKNDNPLIEQEYMKEIFSHLVQTQNLMKQPKIPLKQSFTEYWKKNQRTFEISITMFLVFGMPIYLASPLFNAGTSTIDTISAITWITAFLLGYSIGGNDICNSVGTSYGCNIISLRNALLFGSLFEFLGGIAMGSGVAKTLTKDIIEPDYYQDEPILFALCFPGVLMGAAVTCILATIYGIPVSVSQFVIFGLVAAGLGSKGGEVIGTSGIIKVIIALIASPFVGLIVSFSLFYFIIKVINQSQHPLQRARFYQPLLAFVSIGFSVYFVFHEGVKDLKWYWALLVAAGSGILVGGCLLIYEAIKRKKLSQKDKKNEKYEVNLQPLQSNSPTQRGETKIHEIQLIENQQEQQDPEQVFTEAAEQKQMVTSSKDKFLSSSELQEEIKQCYSIFTPLLLISAFLVAFAHGGNHVGHGVGPLLAVLDVQDNGKISDEVTIPYWGLAFGGGSFAAGILSIGGRTVVTVGQNITTLDPMKAFSTQIGAAIAILISSVLGLPVSTSHCLVGSIIGAFFAEKINKIPTSFQMKMLVKIGISWIITFPIAMFMTLFFYYSLKGVVWDCYLATR